MGYALISPCRNEAEYMRKTLDSVIAQTTKPELWLIIDDGSTDATAKILVEYAAAHDWIQIITKPDRGHRAVGPGVVEAFYFGLERIDIEAYDQICKLDLDLDLPPRYFERLVGRMAKNPRIGSCSGKPYYRTTSGELKSERCGDEMSVGMTKFYRVACFKEIGGFAHEVMWDAIDCHKSRQFGWIAASWDEPDLRFEHLRPMGSSQTGVLTGRMRHGYGQYYMGSDFLFFTATAVFRMTTTPYLIGGLAIWWGYVRAWLAGQPRNGDTELMAFIRRYQRRALIKGKAGAVAEINAAQESLWRTRQSERDHDGATI